MKEGAFFISYLLEIAVLTSVWIWAYTVAIQLARIAPIVPRIVAGSSKIMDI